MHKRTKRAFEIKKKCVGWKMHYMWLTDIYWLGIKEGDNDWRYLNRNNQRKRNTGNVDSHTSKQNGEVLVEKCEKGRRNERLEQIRACIFSSVRCANSQKYMSKAKKIAIQRRMHLNKWWKSQKARQLGILNGKQCALWL